MIRKAIDGISTCDEAANGVGRGARAGRCVHNRLLSQRLRAGFSLCGEGVRGLGCRRASLLLLIVGLSILAPPTKK